MLQPIPHHRPWWALLPLVNIFSQAWMWFPKTSQHRNSESQSQAGMQPETSFNAFPVSAACVYFI